MNPRRLAVLLLSTLAVLAACQPVASVPSVPKPAPAPAYKITHTNTDGTPVRWNPCQPIRYQLNPAGAPAFAGAELKRAVAAIESASGLDLVDAGVTTLRSGDRELRTGDTWSPILITFATATEVPFASPTASGWGQATAGPDETGSYQYVTGQVVLRPGGWTEGTSSANPLSLMLRHELGHVLGLSHVSSTTEIMGTGGNGSARTWGPGDLLGLTKVGASAGCLVEIP